MQGLNSFQRDLEICNKRQSSYSLVPYSFVNLLWGLWGQTRPFESQITSCKARLLHIKFQEISRFAQKKWTRQREDLRTNLTAKVTSLFPLPFGGILNCSDLYLLCVCGMCVQVWGECGMHVHTCVCTHLCMCPWNPETYHVCCLPLSLVHLIFWT